MVNDTKSIELDFKLIYLTQFTSVGSTLFHGVEISVAFVLYVIFYKMANVVKKVILRHINILRWMPKYQKIDVISDMVAGITLGLTMMPQSLAYAALAGVPPQYGLYTAFMGSFAYIFFGTIKEVSIGPTSLLSLLIFSYTDGLNIDHVILLSFLSGWFVFFMGVFKLGFLVDFISTPVTSAFTSATSIIIASSQLKGLFGLTVGNKGTVDMFVKFFQNVRYTKFPDLILGLSSIGFLLAIRQICKIKIKNPKGAKALWLLSISKNALIVLFCSIVAFCFKKYNGSIPFAVSGDIVPGLPAFKLPNFSTVQNNQTLTFFDMAKGLGSGIVVIPIVAVLQNIAIAKAFSVGVIVDATHEMMTLGICNILGSFVQAVPASGAFTRSAVSNASGVRTPFAGLYAASIILLALSFLTPYFYYIPKATLSAVLITAVIFMVDYEILPKLWRCNKFDFVLTLGTFILCLFCGMEFGLVTGIMCNMVIVLKQWTRPQIHANIFVNRKHQEFLVIKPELGLYYPAGDYFTESITKASINNDTPVAIDFSNILCIDYSGCMTLKHILTSFKKQSRQILFFNIKKDVYHKMIQVISEKELNIDNDLNELRAKDVYSNESQKPLLDKPLSENLAIAENNQQKDMNIV
ncbi:STAS domain [Popillia japonica]|uniref:STAS domain n=1 Tax=Popillia japonica TaxID=7064 RepID=A0AAW1MJH4_POPJA